MPAGQLGGIFLTFLGIVPKRSKSKSSQSGGQPISLRFLAPQILRVIFAQSYSGPKRKGMTDEGFLDNIASPFICPTPTILSHSLRCWRSGICIDNVAFTRATSGGKKNNMYWQVSKVFGSPDGPVIQTPLISASTQTGCMVR